MNYDILEEVCERWEEDYVSHKNMLAFGEENVDYDDFADLVKKSYNFIKCFYIEYKSALSKTETNMIFDYLRLVSLIRAYSVTEAFMYCSEEYIVSMVIARLLAENTYYPKYADLNGIIQVSIADGIFDYYEDTSDEILNKVYSYDVNKGDFSDISQFIKYILL